MGKIADIAGGYRFPYNLRELVNPANWRREFKWARQRKQRGWSDRDTWNAGDYIIGVVSGMMKKLGDAKSHIDWDEYFKTNYPNNQGYKSLEEVAKDIDDYIAFDEDSWADTLDFELKSTWRPYDKDPSLTEYVSLNTPQEEREIKKAIAAYHKEWDKRRKKATKAITFVAVNFPALWD